MFVCGTWNSSWYYWQKYDTDPYTDRGTGSDYIKQTSAVNDQSVQILQALRISSWPVKLDGDWGRTQLSGSFLKTVGRMDDKMQTTQLAGGQFRSFSAESSQEIRPKPKLAVAHLIETKITLKLSLLPVSVPKLKPKFGRPLFRVWKLPGPRVPQTRVCVPSSRDNGCVPDRRTS